VKALQLAWGAEPRAIEPGEEDELRFGGAGTETILVALEYREVAGCHAAFQRCNRYGATGLIAASFAMVLWMLPRTLDAARLDFGVDALKLASIFILIGIGVAWSWPRCPPLARAVVHVEAVATLIRFGWAYLAADERLCASYLLEDQRRLGAALVVLGILWAAAVAWRPLFGAPHWVARREPSNAS
jgi:hypothetical protein